MDITEWSQSCLRIIETPVAEIIEKPECVRITHSAPLAFIQSIETPDDHGNKYGIPPESN